MNMHINVADELPKKFRKEINGSRRSLIAAQRRRKCLVGSRPVVYTSVSFSSNVRRFGGAPDQFPQATVENLSIFGGFWGPVSPPDMISKNASTAT